MENNKTCPYCSPDKRIMRSIVEGGSDFLAISNDGTVVFGDDGAVSCYEHLLNFSPCVDVNLTMGKVIKAQYTFVR